MSSRLLLAATLLAASASAQGPFIPPDSLVVVEIDGPAKIRADFTETNLSQMLGSSRVRGITGPLQGLMQMGVRQAERETEADVEGLVDELLAYKGRISIAFNLLTDNPDFNNPPPGGGVLVMDDDGETDLATIAGAIATLIEERAGNMISEIEVGGLALKMVGEHGAGMTLPKIIDGRLVTFVGLPLKDTVELYAAHRNGQGGGLEGSLAIHGNGRKLMKVIRAGIRNADDDEEEAAMALELLDSFGIGNLASFDMHIAPNSKRIVLDTTLAFDGPIRGYFGLFVPDTAGQPALVARTPTDRDVWSVQTFRGDKLLPWIKELLGAMEPQGPVTYEDMVAQFSDQFGLDLEADLFAHLGERMVIAADAAMLPSMVAEEAPDHVCMAFAIKDAAALRATMLTMMEKSGVTPESKTEGDLEIYELNAPDAYFQWAFAEDLAVFSAGKGGTAMLHQLLDGKTHAMPDPITARLALAPKGWDSASSLKLAPMIDTLLTFAKQEEDVPPAVERYTQMFVGLLGDFDLEYLVTAARSGGSQIVQRSIW